MKITPTKSVREGWNGTVAGVQALAKSLERNHRCRKLTYSDLKRMYDTANWEQDFRWNIGDFKESIRYCKIANRLLKAMGNMPVENTLKGEK